MRYFIGLSLPENVRNYLIDVQTQMKQLGIKGNYTISDNFHLTLTYIGEMEDVNLLDHLFMPSLDVSLTLKLSKHNHFNQKIIWVGLEHSKTLHSLQGLIEDQLIEHGLVKKSHYTPHITLCRKANFFKEISLESMTFEINSVILYESKQTKGKLSYIPRKIYPFNSR